MARYRGKSGKIIFHRKDDANNDEPNDDEKKYLDGLNDISGTLHWYVDAGDDSIPLGNGYRLYRGKVGKCWDYMVSLN